MQRVLFGNLAIERSMYTPFKHLQTPPGSCRGGRCDSRTPACLPCSLVHCASSLEICRLPLRWCACLVVVALRDASLAARNWLGCQSRLALAVDGMHGR